MLPGGSCALLKASKLLDSFELDQRDQNYGVQILKKVNYLFEAMKTPIK